MNRQQQKNAALALRLSGATLTDITTTLALNNTQEAKELITAALADEQHTNPQDKQNLRTEEETRILALLRNVWEKASDPEHPEHITATRTALALIDRHAKLLGLDAPTEVVVHNPTQSEIDTWVMTVLQEQTQQALPNIEANFTDTEPDL